MKFEYGNFDEKDVSVAPIDFAFCVRDIDKKKDEADKVIKEIEKTTDELTKENEREAHMKNKFPSYKKLQLSESLFEDFEDEHVGKSSEEIDEMWDTEHFKTKEEQDKWIEDNKSKYQIEPIFVDNGYAVEYRPLKKIGEATENKPIKEEFIDDDSKVEEQAEDIADALSKFLNDTANIENLNDYLDEYDMEHLTKSMDALNHFASNYKKTKLKESKLDESYVLLDLADFKPWSGAVSYWDKIVDADKVDEFDRLLDDLYPDGIREVDLNDWLWFEGDDVLDMLGISKEEDSDEEEED